MEWDDFDYWRCGEWQVVQEKLDDIELARKIYNPGRVNLFAALDLVPFDRVKVAIIGQDPYPDPKLATGLAFSVPKTVEEADFPPTLQNILREYCTDLHFKSPATGNLEAWADEGVLLWNAIPSCAAWKSLSHDWLEWFPLTQEIVKKLSKEGCVFVFLGSVARNFAKWVSDPSKVIETSHPSPRGSLNSKTPFIGSRIFSRANDYLKELGKSPVNWELPTTGRPTRDYMVSQDIPKIVKAWRESHARPSWELTGTEA